MNENVRVKYNLRENDNVRVHGNLLVNENVRVDEIERLYKTHYVRVSRIMWDYK